MKCNTESNSCIRYRGISAAGLKNIQCQLYGKHLTATVNTWTYCRKYGDLPFGKDLTTFRFVNIFGYFLFFSDNNSQDIEFAM